MRALALIVAIGLAGCEPPPPPPAPVHPIDEVPPPTVPQQTNADTGPAPRIVTRIVDGQLVIDELPPESVADVARDIAGAIAVKDAGVDAAPVAGDACAPSRDAMIALQMALRKDHAAAERISAESDVLMRSLGTGVCRMDKATRSARADLLALAGEQIKDLERKRAVLEESFNLEPSVTAAKLLGDLANERNDLRAALTFYQEAQSLRPSSAVASKIKDVTKKLAVEGDFVKRGNAHFSVSFEGNARPELGDIALKHLEDARLRLRDKLGTETATTVQVVLYMGEQYKLAVSGPDWSGGVFDGKIRVREGQLRAEQGDLADVLTHEYVHALMRQSVKAGTVPAWFNEGLAQYCEPIGERTWRLSLLRDIKREQLPTLATLTRSFSSQDRSTANRSYACALDLVEEMNAVRGERALVQLFDELEAGTPFADAFESAYGLTLRRFEERWREKYPSETQR